MSPFKRVDRSGEESDLDDVARSAERLGRLGYELFDVSDETREELEEVHEVVDPETGGKFQLLIANPKGEKGTVIVNSDFAADVENKPTKEFLAYLADLYPDYKIVFEAPPGYGTDSLKKFADTERKSARTKRAFSVIARPSLRALGSLGLGEDVVIIGASMGAHIAVEQALVAGEEGVPVNKVVLLAGPMEERSTMGLIRAFTGDDKLAQEQVENSPYLQSIIPTQEEKNKKAREGGLSGIKHMLRYARDLAHSELEDGLVELVLEREGPEVEVILGSQDSVAKSSTYAGAIARIKAGGKTLKRQIGIGWSHGTLADIPRRVVNVVPAVGRGGPEKLKELTKV